MLFLISSLTLPECYVYEVVNGEVRGMVNRGEVQERRFKLV